MRARPTALYISPGYPACLDRLPFTVHTVSPPAGIFDLPAYLDQTGLVPDMVFQDEVLAPRVLVMGLGSLACPAAYWSRDPHLNHAWQAHYAAQFDLVASTQKAWVEPFRRLGVGRAFWLPWSEPVNVFRPHAKRSHPVGFVGRMTEHRPKRRLFAEFLERAFQAAVESDLPPAEVRGVYADVRLSPDESLHSEITHRLFAGAAAGCLPVIPRADSGLEELFTPGAEVLTYDGALELGDVLRWGLDHPDRAQAMGLAARTRLVAEHQPAIRLERLGRAAMELGAPSPRPSDETAFWLGAASCLESGLLPNTEGAVLAALAQRRDDPECFRALMALMAFAGRAPQALDLAAARFAAGFAPAHGPFLLTLAALALKTGQRDTARRVLARLAAAQLADPVSPEDGPARAYLALAQAWRRLGAERRPGFPFDADRNLPACTAECLVLAHQKAPGDPVVTRRLEGFLRGLPGMEVAHLGLACELSLASPDDFRRSVAVGLADIAVFRPEQGLEELVLARDKAERQGKLPVFERLLAGQDPSGRVRRALGAFRAAAPGASLRPGG